MHDQKLISALSMALRMRLEASATPESVLAAAERELAQWVAADGQGMEPVHAEILAVIQHVIAQERERLGRAPH